MNPKITSVAVAAFVAAMLIGIGASSFPTAFAVKGENPKTDTDTGPRTNPNDHPLPGDETTTTTEACTTPGGSTPPGHEPNGDCKGNDAETCTQTTQVFLPNGKPKGEPTTTAC